jgi:hypothetical protein
VPCCGEAEACNRNVTTPPLSPQTPHYIHTSKQLEKQNNERKQRVSNLRHIEKKIIIRKYRNIFNP